MDGVIRSLTDVRDGLGIGALLASLLNSGLFEKLGKLSTNEYFSMEEVSDFLEVDYYFIEPVFEILNFVGVIKKESSGKYVIDHDNYGYVQKMLNALPLYLSLSSYFQKATGKPFIHPPDFNQFITNASSRLAKPAIEGMLDHYPSLGKDKIKVLDVGSGTGQYLINLAKRNKSMIGQGIEIDREVAETAIENIQNESLEDRLKITNANFLELGVDELPKDFNVFLLNHIYHVIGEELSSRITKKGYSHLKGGGMFFNMEICKDYPSRKEIIPLIFDALMRFFYSENKGKGFKKGEIEKIMQDNGFYLPNQNHLPIKFDTPNMVYFVGIKKGFYPSRLD